MVDICGREIQVGDLCIKASGTVLNYVLIRSFPNQTRVTFSSIKTKKFSQYHDVQRRGAWAYLKVEPHTLGPQKYADFERHIEMLRREQDAQAV